MASISPDFFIPLDLEVKLHRSLLMIDCAVAQVTFAPTLARGPHVVRSAIVGRG